MGFMEHLNKIKRWISGDPLEGETYDEVHVKDLPHIEDNDGALIAVSSGKHELSPVVSAKYHIQPGEGKPDNIDDKI
ncbi:uncharacterized protein SCDLUD_002323 [Saccharomycodes ludwigii]|uniref:uncharacterized protein n=1 Tax=Saccharomycodes ludwigii TaxID=36035 RepID=UPI001E881FA4|nr:hypothetical protein SCDLUD_002323 [Saccharomycodes ludwigii]KAH3900867.1 hypothetical protein SCDLUD_002323 [Saccharomycodes ludwigii]